jgi:hypothetical protein
MAKLPSAVRVVQSYLAFIPVAKTLELLSPEIQQERWGLKSRPSDVVVLGKFGTEKRQVFRDPARLITDFANTQSDLDGVLRFTKRYGALHREELDYIPEVDDIGDDRLCVPCSRWLARQKEFRDQWISKGKADKERAKAFAKHIHPMSSDSPAVKTFVIPGRHGAFQLEARPDELLGALWLALLGFSGRTRKCENPTCVAPYFIASRRDQKYCNEACSRLVANRKWWSEKGTQWRENRLKNERRKTR